MDFEAIQDALRDWLIAVTGLAQVVWENEPRPALLRERGFGILSITDVTGLGQDYVQEATAADPDELTLTVVGQRLLSVNVRVVSRSQSPNSTGRYYLERARLSLKMPSVLATFQEAGLAVATIGKTVTYDAPFDERVESISALELVIATTSTLEDLGGDIGTIGAIELSSDIEPAPTPPNLDAEVITLPD